MIGKTQTLIGLKCFNERFHLRLKQWNSYKEMVHDLYATARDPNATDKERIEARKMIDTLFEGVIKSMGGTLRGDFEWDSDGNIVEYKTS